MYVGAAVILETESCHVYIWLTQKFDLVLIRVIIHVWKTEECFLTWS